MGVGWVLPIKYDFSRLDIYSVRGGIRMLAIHLFFRNNSSPSAVRSRRALGVAHGQSPVGGLRGMGAHGILRTWAHVHSNSRHPRVRSGGLMMAAYCRNVNGGGYIAAAVVPIT